MSYFLFYAEFLQELLNDTKSWINLPNDTITCGIIIAIF